MGIMNRGKTLFRVAGLPIRANVSWLILVGMLIVVLARGPLPQIMGEAPAAVYWALAVVGATGLFASLLAHELCHSLVARWQGMAVGGITLFVFGGVSELEDEPPTAASEFLMAAAGPWASVAIGCCLAIVWTVGNIAGWHVGIQAVLMYVWMMNFILAAFNLLPAFPLDGGRILRSLLWAASGDMNAATRVAARVGLLFGLGLIFVGAWLLLDGNALPGIWLMLVGFFLQQAAGSNLRMAELRSRLAGENVTRFMATPLIVVPQDADLRTFVGDYVFRYRASYYPVVDDDGLLVGSISARAPRSVRRRNWPRTPVRSVMTPATRANTLGPDAEAAEVLTALRLRDERRLVVVENGRPLGTVSLRDLLDFLSLKSDLAGR